MTKAQDFKNLGWLFKQMLPSKDSDYIEVEFQHRYMRCFVQMSAIGTILKTQY